MRTVHVWRGDDVVMLEADSFISGHWDDNVWNPGGGMLKVYKGDDVVGLFKDWDYAIFVDEQEGE